MLSINSGDKSADFVGDLNTSGKLTNTGGAKLDIGADKGSSNGIFLNESFDTNWGIYMASTNSLNDGNAVSGHNFSGLNAYALRLRASTSSNTGVGFIFENDNEERVFSINSNDKSGDIVGDLTVGRWLYMNNKNMKIGDSNNDGSSFEFTNTNDSKYGIVHSDNGAIYMKGSSRVQIESYLDMFYNKIKHASDLSVETLSSTQAKNKITSNTTLDMSENDILVSGYNLLTEIENIAFVTNSGIASLQSQFDSLGALAYYNDMSLNGIVQETSNGYTYVPQRLGVTTKSPQYSIDTGTSDIRTRTTYFDYGSGHSFIGYSDDGWGRDRAELYLFSNGSTPSSIDMGLNNTTDSNTYYTFESFAGTGENSPYNNDDDKLTLWEGPALNGWNVIWSYYPARNQFDIDKPTEIRNTLNVQNTLTNTGGAKLEIQNGVDGGSGAGIFMWESNRTDWGIYMAKDNSLADGNAVSGHNFSSHAIRFRVDNNSGNGFIFENHAEERVMSINSTDKSADINGNMNTGQWCYMNNQNIRVGDRDNNGEYAELTNLNDNTWGVLHQDNGDVRLKGSNRVKIDSKLTNNEGAKLDIHNGSPGGSGAGIFLYDQSSTVDGIYMASSGSGQSLNDSTAVSGHNFTEQAVRFRTQNASNQGFIFENHDEQRVFSINTGDKTADFNGQISFQDKLYCDKGGTVARFDNPNGGLSEIRFNSGNNTTSDFATIAYHDDFRSYGSTNENSALVIDVQNDGAGDSEDRLYLRARGDIVMETETQINATKNLEMNNNDLDNVNSLNFQSSNAEIGYDSVDDQIIFDLDGNGNDYSGFRFNKFSNTSGKLEINHEYGGNKGIAVMNEAGDLRLVAEEGFSTVEVDGGSDFSVSGNKNACLKDFDNDRKVLYSCVESNRGGRFIFDYTIDIDDSCQKTIELPDYFTWSCCDAEVIVQPKKHFGIGYGEVIEWCGTSPPTPNECGGKAQITVNQNGKYYIMIIGTRNREFKDIDTLDENSEAYEANKTNQTASA